MPDDEFTRRVYDQLNVQPESARFFEELQARLERKERDAVRRWRRTAIVAVAVALAATAVAGVAVATPTAAANTVDVTVQCPNLEKGGVGVFSVFAEPTGNPPIESGKIKPPPPGFRPIDGMTVETGDSTYTLRLTSLVAGYQLDRRQCLPSKTKLKLGPDGLPKHATFHVGDNEYGERCTDVPKVVMRLRISNDAYGAPTRAQLLIVRAKTNKPLVYVDWSRAKVTAWDSPGCDFTQ
jgi:hypothetical protein